MYDHKQCRSCIYSAKLNESDAHLCCVYILVEGKRRGCYGDGMCPEYQKRLTKRRKRITKGGGLIYYDKQSD